MPIIVTAEQQAILHRITQQHTAPQRLVRRVRIILAANQGLNNAQICRRHPPGTGGNVGLKAVKRWRKRWSEATHALQVAQDDAEQLRLLIEQTLSDTPRSGSPLTFAAEEVAQIIALACQDPTAVTGGEDTGRPVTHWTNKELADEAVKQGIVQQISPRSVGRFLKRSRDQATSESLLAQS
jgi:putative transposase